MIMSYKT